VKRNIDKLIGINRIYLSLLLNYLYGFGFSISFTLAEQLKNLAQEKSNKKWEANALHMQGASCYLKGNRPL